MLVTKEIMKLKTITDLRIMIILRKVIIMTSFPFKQFVMKTISNKDLCQYQTNVVQHWNNKPLQSG